MNEYAQESYLSYLHKPDRQLIFSKVPRESLENANHSQSKKISPKIANDLNKKKNAIFISLY